MTEINLNRKLNWKHRELFQSTAPILAVRGGANAGKTYSIADKLLLQPIVQNDRPLKAVCIKKTMPSLKKTILDVLEKRAQEVFAVPLQTNMSMNRARFMNLTIDFLSLNNKEDYIKAKSMTDIDFIWVNEITELREYDFDILNMRIRGGKSSYSQFIFDFNPVGKTSWVFKRFYETANGKNGVDRLLYTVFDNPWAKPDEIEKLRAYKDQNLNLYNIYFLGEWGELEGIIFNWGIVPDPPKNPDEVFYGGDFGYSVNPAAVIRIYRKADEFWLEEIIYETGLTNHRMTIEAKRRGIDLEADCYWDSAEPKSIQELYDLGWIGSKPAEKGPDSVRAGIDFLQTKKIHVIDGSENIIREQKGYTRRTDKDGRFLPDPIKINDHAMSGIRYGICTHMKRAGVGAGTVAHDVSPD